MTLRGSVFLAWSALVLWTAAPSAAHDVWLQARAAGPASGNPAAGEKAESRSDGGHIAEGQLVALGLWQGHADEAEPLPRNDRLLLRLQAIGPAGEVVNLPGRHGQAPAGFFRPSSAGSWTVLYEGRPSLYRLPPERFERYLEEEGLDHILRERERQAAEDPTKRDQEGRELVSRSLKALIAASGPDLAVGSGKQIVDRPVGLPVELVLERVVNDRDTAHLELLLRVDGRPHPGVLVDLQELGPDLEAPNRFETRTTAEGVAAFSIPRHVIGAKREPLVRQWLAAAVYSRPSPSPEADWRTFFTTLTFELGSDSPLVAGDVPAGPPPRSEILEKRGGMR